MRIWKVSLRVLVVDPIINSLNEQNHKADNKEDYWWNFVNERVKEVFFLTSVYASKPVGTLGIYILIIIIYEIKD